MDNLNGQKSPVSAGANETKNTDNNIFIYLFIAGLVLLVVGMVAFLLISKPVISSHLYLMLGIAGLILIFGIGFVAILIKKGEAHKPDYYALFIIGVLWIPMGTVLDNYGLSVMGFIFMIIGLLKRDKWKVREKWSEMSEGKKRLKLAFIVILGLGVLAGLVAYYLVAK